jgi:hypothetical protein
VRDVLWAGLLWGLLGASVYAVSLAAAALLGIPPLWEAGQ